jgi:hypothetical protein
MNTKCVRRQINIIVEAVHVPAGHVSDDSM